MSFIYLLEGGDTKVYRSNKGSSVREARDLSSQNPKTIYQITEFETLAVKNSELQILMLSGQRWWYRKRICFAIRNGVAMPAWVEERQT